jgi:O-antigen/teichoic acid export membrane protein
VVIAVPAVGLALNLALNLALLPRFGLAAAAASSTAAYGVMLLLAWRAFARRTSIPLRECCLLTAADLGALRLRLRALLAGGTN